VNTGTQQPDAAHETRRGPRLSQALSAPLAAVAACALTLAGLTAWTTAGAAGTPAHLTFPHWGALSAKCQLNYRITDTRLVQNHHSVGTGLGEHRYSRWR
jgi:hypothetical protein